MRRIFIAGNWKMNLNRQGCVDLAAALAAQFAGSAPDSAKGPQIAVCPPFVYLDAVRQALADSSVGLGGQNLYPEPDGAFTGEINAPMLIDLGCRYVILGHSERRHILGETDEMVSRKVQAALAAGLTPIVCVGETLEHREQGATESVVDGQISGSLKGVTGSQMGQVVIAYEPVWAIGTGKTASPEQAEQVHAHLRNKLEKQYSTEVAAKVQIQYGGSVKPANAKDLLGQPNIDGALVGGASLKAEDFLGIIQHAG